MLTAFLSQLTKKYRFLLFEIVKHTRNSIWAVLLNLRTKTCSPISSAYADIHARYTLVLISKNAFFFHLRTISPANSADPGEMPHHAAFHLGIHCLSKYPFKGF